MKLRNLMLVMGLLVGASAGAAEGNAQGAAVQQQEEATERVRQQDGQGETTRAEEKNRVRAGEVGSQQAQDMQARNRERKMEHSQTRIDKPAGQGAGQKGNKGNKGNKGDKGKKAKNSGNRS